VTGSSKKSKRPGDMPVVHFHHIQNNRSFLLFVDLIQVDAQDKNFFSLEICFIPHNLLAI
jgi:hypothetical protein